MKNFLKATLFIAFLSFGGWALTMQPAIYRKTNVTDKDDKKQSPRDLFLHNCARCHGEDGKSQSKIGISLEATDLTSREVRKMNKKNIIKVITNGEDKMPAFDKKLSSEEIKTLAKYIRSFK